MVAMETMQVKVIQCTKRRFPDYNIFSKIYKEEERLLTKKLIQIGEHFSFESYLIRWVSLNLVKGK